MKINFILDTNDKIIDVCYNGYNIIKTSIYDVEFVEKIKNQIEDYLKNDDFNFDNFEDYLKY